MTDFDTLVANVEDEFDDEYAETPPYLMAYYRKWGFPDDDSSLADDFAAENRHGWEQV